LLDQVWSGEDTLDQIMSGHDLLGPDILC